MSSRNNQQALLITVSVMSFYTWIIFTDDSSEVGRCQAMMKPHRNQPDSFKELNLRRSMRETTKNKKIE